MASSSSTTPTSSLSETIERLSLHYQRLLEELVSDPDQPLNKLSLLTPEERRQVVEEWNDTATDCPDRPGLIELFDEQVALHPDRPAVIGPDAAVSFKDLSRQVARLAGRLDELGVGPEVRVGVCLPRSPDLMTALLAVLRVGGVYVPLDPTHPADRLGYIIADAGVEVLLTNSAAAAALPGSTARTVLLDEMPGSRGRRRRQLPSTSARKAPRTSSTPLGRPGARRGSPFPRCSY